MVDVDKHAEVDPPTAVSLHLERQSGPYAGGCAPRPPLRRHDAEDIASILGIPLEELTPKVQSALERLLKEFDGVRKELDLSRERELYLRSLSEGHPFLPVRNRRSLLRELSRVIDRARVSQTANSFLCLTIDNGAEIRAVHGQAAAQAMLAEVVAELTPQLRASDVLGSLGGYDFGIILTLAGGAAASRKAAQLAEVVASLRVAWRGLRLKLRPAWGLRELGPSDSPEAAIDGADQDLLSRAKRA
jgi:diguanylate cyclase (GGDEF)-like protein